MGCFLTSLSSASLTWAFNQRTQYEYGVLQVFNWLLCGLRLPSTNAPSMWCFARRKKDSFFLRDLQPTHPVWGTSVRWVHRDCLFWSSTNASCMGCFYWQHFFGVWLYSFNQRTPYGGASCDVVYLDLPSTNASCMGCFDFCYFVTSHDTPSTNAPSIWCFGPTAIICLDGDSFNQRTQYGVLHANGNLITLYMNLQPTHPVCGASVSVDGQSQHISPSTNAPSMGCFCKIHRYISFRAPSTNAPSMGCFHNRPR